MLLSSPPNVVVISYHLPRTLFVVIIFPECKAKPHFHDPMTGWNTLRQAIHDLLQMPDGGSILHKGGSAEIHYWTVLGLVGGCQWWSTTLV